MVDVTSPQSSNPASQGYYQVPIKPMYGLNGMAPQAQSMPAKVSGNRRQVIQQIIHNNGSGNILFSSGGAALAHGGQGGRRLNTYHSAGGSNQYNS